MKWVTGVVLVVVVGLSLVFPVTVLGAAPNVLIVGIQTGSTTSASDEIIKIANISANTVDISSCQLQYFAAAAKNFSLPSRVIKLQGILAAGQQYTLSSTGYPVDGTVQSFAATLAAAGGHLRLVCAATEVDLVGWGTATMPRGAAAPAPPAGVLLKRKLDPAGNYINSNNNAQDFALDNSQIPSVGQLSGGGLLRLSELLPDPTSPTSDAQGEFIELYNPSSETVNTTGYVLRSGNGQTKTFTLPSNTLPAGGLLVYFASQSKLSLANNGSRVQLLDSNGQVIDETSYSTAPMGSAWVWDGNSWQWTTTPTPGQPNVITESESPVENSVKKKAVTKKSTKASKKTAKKTQVKAASTVAGQVSSGDQTSQSPAPLHTGVVAGVGGLAVLYGLYEYRQDLANTFRKFRRH